MADIQSNINVNVDTSAAVASIKALQAQISAFHKSMATGSATASSAAAQFQQKLIDSVNATGKFSATMQTVKSTTDSFTSSLEKNKFSLGQYFRYSVAATKSFGNAYKTEMGVINKVARDRVKDIQTQYINLGKDVNGAIKSIAIKPLLLDLENMQTKTALAAQKQQILNQLLKQGSTNLLNFGKNTQWAGRQLMVGFTIPLSMAATAAAKAYMDIEKASIKIERVYGDLNTTAEETNKVVASIKDLASEYTKYGIAVADTMEMASTAAAMGKTGAELLAQVNEATRLAALGGVEQAQALETTISLTSAFGLSADQLSQKVNYLNAVENQTVTSIEDLTIAIPKAGPVIRQLGGDVEDLAFFLTAMREGGINASEGANALKSGLAALINPTKKSSEMLAGFGINIKAIVEGNKGDIKKTVIDFATALNTIDPLNRARAIEQMFGKFQFARISTLLQNVTSSSSQASKALSLANMSSIQLAAMSRRELDRIAASPMYKFQKAIADLQVKIAPVGESFLKAVTPIVEWVSKILQGFNGMSEEFKNFAVIGTAVVGGLAPVLLMVIGLVANGAANIIKLFANIKSFFNKTTTSSQVLGETTSFLTAEQIRSEAAAVSLNQIHTKLQQTFTSEASAAHALADALQRVTASSGMSMVATKATPKGKKFANGGMVYGPGTKTSDSIPANLSNGEAVIDADTVSKNPAVISALFAGKKINIPGYANNNSADMGMSQASRVHASHFEQLSPINLGSTIKRLGDSLNGLIVDIYTLQRKIDGEGYIATKSSGPLSSLAESPAVMSGGRSFSGTTVPESSRRNLAYEAAGIGGAAFNLNEVVANGKKAATALSGQSVESIRYAEELRKLVAQGQVAERTLADKNNAEQSQISFMRDNAKRSMTVALMERKKLTFSEASAKVESILVESDKKIVAIQRSGIDRKQLIATAESTYLANMLETNSQYAQGPEGSGRKALRDVSANRVRRTGPDSVVRQYDRVDGIYSGRTATVMQAQLEKGFNPISGLTDKSLEKDAVAGAKKKGKIQSPSREMMKVGEDLAQGAINGTKSKIAAAKLAGIEVGESVALGARTSRLGPVGATTIPFTPITQSAQYQTGRTAQTTSRVASPFVQDVKASFVNMRSNIQNEMRMISNDTKSALEQLKNIFRRGGNQAAEAAKSGLIQAGPQIKIAGKNAGFDYVAALKGGNGAIAAVITRGNQNIISNALTAYNAGGFKIAGAVNLGLEKGIAGSLGRAVVAGQKLANAEIDGVESVTKKIPKKTRNLGLGEQGALLPGQKRGTFMQRAGAKYDAVGSKVASGIDSKLEGVTAGKLAGLGTAATTATFALSMMPGPIGQFAQMLLPVISVASMLAPILTALAGAAGMTVGAFVVAAAPFVAAAAAVALLVTGIVLYNNALADAKKKEISNINRMSSAASAASNAMDGIKEAAGVSGRKSLIEIAAGKAKGIGVKQLDNVSTLLSSPEFTDKKSKTNKLVNELKKTKGNEAQAIFNRIGADLLASSATEQVVQDTIKALQIASEKTSVVFNFKNIKFGTKQGQVALQNDIQSLVTASAKAFSVDIPKKLKYGGRGGSGSAETKEIDKTSEAYIRLKAAADSFGSIAGGQIANISTLFASGALSAKDFELNIQTITSGFAELDAESRKLSVAKMFQNMDSEVRKAANGIDNATAKLKYLQIVALGGTVSDSIISLLNGTSPGEQAAGEKALEERFNKIKSLAKKIYGDAAVTTPGTTGDKSTKSSPKDILTNLLEENKAAQLNQKLMRSGYGSDFVSMIATADAATRKFYTNTAGGLNAQGKALLAAYNTKIIRDFQNATELAQRNIAAELEARKALTGAFKEAGLTAVQANEFAAKAEVQARIQVIKTTVAKDKQAEAIKKVVEALIAEAKAQEGLKTANEQFNEAYDKGTKYLDTQIAKINLEFDMDPKNKANKKAIEDANNAIQDLQTGVNGKIGLDQYNNALSKLQFREDEINKKYEERTKALDKIAKINQKISDQQKGQLSLAQALSSGDIAAAAMAAQEMTAASAASNIEDQKAALEIAKQKEIDGLTVEINGKLYTRKEIETASKKIQEEILDIQIKQLAPATTALGLAERYKNTAISAINDQKLAWDNWKLSVDLAALSLGAYLKLISTMPSLAGAAATEIAAPGNDSAGGSSSGTGGSTTPAESAEIVAARSAVATAQTKVDRIKERITASRKAGTVATTIALSGQLKDAEAALATAENALTRLLNAATTVKKNSTIMAATGGYISGKGTGTSDSIPAMLSNGEYVLKASAVKNLGVGFLNGLNESGNRVVPSSFADGGFVVDRFSASDLGVNRLSSTPTAQSLSSEIVSVVSNSATAVTSSAYTDASVYNYSVSVNVRSDANPDQIAQAVIGKINSTNSQRIRGNRF